MSSTPEPLTSPVPLTKVMIQMLWGVFDAKFYVEEYGNLDLLPQDLFVHFMFKGVHEGRSPNPFFDVSEYLASNRDVLLSGMNPYYHFQVHGKQEGRSATSVVRTRQRIAVLSDRNDLEWIETIRPYINENYYKRQLTSTQPYLTGHSMDLAAHYSLLGWKLRLDPSPTFSTSRWLENNVEQSGFRLNPLLLDILGFSTQALHEIPAKGAVQTSNNSLPLNERITVPENPQKIISTADNLNIEAPNASAEQVVSSPAHLQGEVVEEILALGLFDNHYYLSTYLDVADAGVDPFQHFMNQGWREGRDPSSRFSTAFYLANYPDAASSGLNPLVHYVLRGRQAGYLIKASGGWKMEVLERCVAPAIREASFSVFSRKKLTYEAFKKAILGKALKRNESNPLHLLFAVSHDSYSTVTGGTQIFIADEMNNAKLHGVTHVHIAPATPGLTVAGITRTTDVIVTINGDMLGVIESAKVFLFLRTTTYLNIRVSIHSLIGFSASVMDGLASVAQMARTFLWLHDYSTVCDGFNLLRNDVAFCGVPSAESVECQICVYGSNRSERQSRLHSWFSKVNPVVVAPSEAALSIWKRSKCLLPVKSSIVIPHWVLIKARKRKHATNSVLRIAFVGYAVSSKGWPVFNEIVETLAAQEFYEFFHFIKGGKSPNSLVQGIDCAVSVADRLGTASLLRKHKIDIVMIMSPWPETFSYVAAEALIAGCAIVCFENSGNVRSLVETTKQGFVFKNAEALFEAVTCGTLLNTINQLVEHSYFHTTTQNQGIFDVIAQNFD